MATRDLKGLTIEIGGDTSKLTDSLKSVDSELSSLQSNLRTVNSALKLDPGNVDALAQKQSLLSEAVQTTTQRLDALKEAQRQADEQMANGVEVDQRAYRSLQSEIVRAQASLNDYTRQLNDMERASDATSDSTDDLSENLGDASQSADNLAENTEDAGNAAENSNEGWSTLKDIIADLASEAIQAAIQAFKDLVFEGEKALDFLQAKIGASSADMQKYADVAEEVFKNGWGESITDVAESIGTVTQMLGDLDKADLKNVTQHALTLRDVFGWDVKESIRAANSLMDQFGITSDEAFNLMVQGAQNGLDQNDDLLDTINEYSVQFRDAGYSADDMFNMLANGAKSGTWSVDKLGDAVKEMNIRISDGTADDAFKALKLGVEEAATSSMKLTKEYTNLEKAQGNYNEAVREHGKNSEEAQKAQEKLTEAQQKYNEKASETTINISAIKDAFAAGGEEAQTAMQTVMEALAGVDDETQRYQLGVQIFGTMWEDLGEDAVQALLDTEGGIKSTNEAMSQVETDAYDNLSSSVATLGRTLKSEILNPIVEDISPVLKGLVDWAVENIDTLKPIIIGVGAALGVVTAAIIGAKVATIALNAAMSVNPIFLAASLIIAAIVGVTTAIIALINRTTEAEKAVKANAEGVTSFTDALAKVKPAITDVTTQLSAYGRTIADIDTAIDEAETGITTILSTALSERRTLREEEIKSIEDYNKRIKELEQEKLDMYRQQMTVEMMKIGAETQTLTQEQTAQYIANLEEQIAQANEVSMSAYEAQLAQIQNFHQTQGTLNSEAYLRDIEAARVAHEQELAENASFYQQGIGMLQENANQWIMTDSEKWDKFNESGWMGKNQYAKLLAELDLDNANAWLSMYTTTVQAGGDIDAETQKIAGAMINAFDDLPSGMEEAGKDALLGIVKGLEGQIPELENASDMSAQEIVDTLKEELQINSPSKVTEGIGANVSEGLRVGMDGKKSLVSTTATGIAGTIATALKSKDGEMNSIGANMITGVEAGMQSKKSWIGTKISNLASGLVSSFKKAFNIQSPSRVMRDQIGAMLAEGIGVGIEENADAALDPMESLKNDLVAFDGLSVSKSISVDGAAQSGVQKLIQKIEGLATLIDHYLPEIAGNAKKNIYLDKNRLVGELASDMDAALGEIAERKAVGAV